MGLESSSSANPDLKHRPICSLFRVEASSQPYNNRIIQWSNTALTHTQHGQKPQISLPGVSQTYTHQIFTGSQAV